MAFSMFQNEMRTLLNEMKERGEPPADDQDIAAQLYRVMAENSNICENRILSEIGMLFVEGFETTGGNLAAACRRALLPSARCHCAASWRRHVA